MASETQYYHHGLVHFSGGTLPNAITAYRTHGDPKNPCIIFPTCYGARLDDQYYLLGENKALDPRRYFIVTFALFSNGESSSPSNTPAPHNGPYFPKVTYVDNVNAQYEVLTKKLGVKRIFCSIGHSMGGQLSYQWTVQYPDFVERFICICGSARTSPHNKCFIEGPKSALLASKDFESGHYAAYPQRGIRAFGRVYCAWAYGQTWYRQHGYLLDGTYADLESFMRGVWENMFLEWDAHDMLTLMATWTAGDISAFKHGGDFEKALKSISAKGLVMPSKTDLYFPPEDSEYEVANLANGKLVVIDTIWGHMAGGGANQKDIEFMAAQIQEFLNT